MCSDACATSFAAIYLVSFFFALERKTIFCTDAKMHLFVLRGGGKKKIGFGLQIWVAKMYAEALC